MKETYKLVERHPELVSQSNIPKIGNKESKVFSVSQTLTYTGREVIKDSTCTQALKVWFGIISRTSYVLLWIEGNLTHILWLKYKN